MALGAAGVPCRGNFGLTGTVDASKWVQLLDKERLHHNVSPLHHMVLWAVAPEAITDAIATCISPHMVTVLAVSTAAGQGFVSRLQENLQLHEHIRTNTLAAHESMAPVQWDKPLSACTSKPVPLSV